MNRYHKIYFGDSRKMPEINDNSVHLIVTSPPYWQLKDYGVEGQIGFDDSYEDYINNLNLVWKECYRVLHPGCRMVVNIGDQFARSVYYGRYKVIPIREEIIRFCETIGFDYMGAIIWQKKTTLNTTGGATVMGSYPYPRNGIIEIDYEFILIFKKQGKPPKVKKEIKEAAKLTKEEWKEYFSGHWYFNGVRQEDHIAMFPLELPMRIIKMFSFPGETVLDPFLGSGTTTLAAMMLDRNSIGYEINKDFRPVIEKKLNNVFAGGVEYVDLPPRDINWQEEFKDLPYIFKDPVKIDKKIDPRLMTFGSSISQKQLASPVEYYSVKEIISPEVLVLNNGIKVKLIGVKERTEKKKEAMEFLRLKTKGQKVVLRFDNQKYDQEGNLLVYMYLKNKTFLNAHLIKLKLADVDDSFEYKFKSRFINYAG